MKLWHMTDGEDLIQINKAHKRLGKLPAKDFGKIGNDNEGSFGIDKYFSNGVKKTHIPIRLFDIK